MKTVWKVSNLLTYLKLSGKHKHFLPFKGLLCLGSL